MEALPILVSLYFLISNHSPCPTWQCILKTNKTNWSSSYTIWASQVALVIKNPPANAGDLRDTVSVLGLGRFPGGGHSEPLQYSCLENTMDRRACWATVHRVAKSWTRLKWLSRHACMHAYIMLPCIFIPLLILFHWPGKPQNTAPWLKKLMPDSSRPKPLASWGIFYWTPRSQLGVSPLCSLSTLNSSCLYVCLPFCLPHWRATSLKWWTVEFCGCFSSCWQSF